MRLGNAKLMSLVKTCTSQFRQHQLMQFDDRGKPADPCFRVRGLDVPLGFPGLENGQLSFSGVEVAACFIPVVERVVEMVGEVVRRRDNPEGLGISVCVFQSSFTVDVTGSDWLTSGLTECLSGRQSRELGVAGEEAEGDG
jgi:hypothetical protein